MGIKIVGIEKMELYHRGFPGIMIYHMGQDLLAASTAPAAAVLPHPNIPAFPHRFYHSNPNYLPVLVITPPKHRGGMVK